MSQFALKDNFLVPQVLTLLLTYYYPSIWKSVADTWKDLGPVVRSLVSANCWRDIKTYRFRWLALTMLRATRACQGPVSRKSRDFSGAFRVTLFSLYLQNEGVSAGHETLQLF